MKWITWLYEVIGAAYWVTAAVAVVMGSFGAAIFCLVVGSGAGAYSVTREAGR